MEDVVRLARCSLPMLTRPDVPKWHVQRLNAALLAMSVNAFFDWCSVSVEAADIAVEGGVVGVEKLLRPPKLWGIGALFQEAENKKREHPKGMGQK